MKLNECPSEHSSYGRHCFCIREGQSKYECCYCEHVVHKYERRNQMTVCLRWIHEDDSELRSEILKYCDHDYCHGRGGTMSTTGYTMKITIEQLPSGHFIMRNEQGDRIWDVTSDSDLATFIEKMLEKGSEEWLSKVDAAKPKH